MTAKWFTLSDVLTLALWYYWPLGLLTLTFVPFCFLSLRQVPLRPLRRAYLSSCSPLLLYFWGLLSVIASFNTIPRWHFQVHLPHILLTLSVATIGLGFVVVGLAPAWALRHKLGLAELPAVPMIVTVAAVFLDIAMWVAVSNPMRPNAG